MNEEKKIDLENLEADEIKKGVYLCHTGNEYRVLFEATDTKDHEGKVVVYQSLKDNGVWVRSKEEFLGFKEVNGEKKKRFIFLREEEEDSFENKYLRALADYQNLLKQTGKEKAEFIKYALTDFLHNILPIYDHLKLSMKGLSEAEAKNPWAQGVSHVLKQFKEVLAQHGIEEIKTVGEKFDHDLMEAIDGTGEKIKQEVMPGYKLNGKVIRPAKVIVEAE